MSPLYDIVSPLYDKMSLITYYYYFMAWIEFTQNERKMRFLLNNGDIVTAYPSTIPLFNDTLIVINNIILEYHNHYLFQVCKGKLKPEKLEKTWHQDPNVIELFDLFSDVSDLRQTIYVHRRHQNKAGTKNNLSLKVEIENLDKWITWYWEHEAEIKLLLDFSDLRTVHFRRKRAEIRKAKKLKIT